MDYREKYFKYKSKYLSAKQVGGLGGHLQVYFLTQSDYDTLKNDPKHNFKIPGTKVALTSREKYSPELGTVAPAPVKVEAVKPVAPKLKKKSELENSLLEAIEQHADE